MQKTSTFYSNRLADSEFLEDVDSRLVYTGNWVHEDANSDVYWRGSNGYYANPGDQVGVEYKFYGTRFVLWAPATSDPDITGANVRLYIDGVEVPNVTQRVANPDTSVEFNQSWAWYTSPWLPLGQHTFKLTSNTSSEGYIVFDGVQILRTPAPVKKTMQLAFGGTNTNGGDQTYFFDKVEVIDQNGQVVDAGLVNADFSYPPIPNEPGRSDYYYLHGNTDPLLGWAFGGGSGIAADGGSGFNVPDTPDGNAVCFIQGNTPPTTQNMSLYPGKYRIRFIAAQRSDSQDNDGYITIAGDRVMYVHPQQGVGFQTYTSDEFTV